MLLEEMSAFFVTSQKQNNKVLSLLAV